MLTLRFRDGSCRCGLVALVDLWEWVQLDKRAYRDWATFLLSPSSSQSLTNCATAGTRSRKGCRDAPPCRVLRRPSHMDSATVGRAGSQALSTGSTQQDSEENEEGTKARVALPTTSDLRVHIGGGVVDPFVPFPLALDHVSEELIANSEQGRTKERTRRLILRTVFQYDYQRPHRDDWFTVGLRDRSTFLQVLANSALHFEGVRKLNGSPEQSKLATTYYHMAVMNVNKRLLKLQQEGVLVSRAGSKQESAMTREIDALIGTASAFICFTVCRARSTKKTYCNTTIADRLRLA